MSLLDKFKKKKDDKAEKAEPAVEPTAKVAAPAKPELVKKEKVANKLSKEDTGNAYKILVKPIITERASELSALGKYVFEVARAATKNEVKKAVHSLYGVDVVKVNMINFSGKKVRYGRSQGSRKNWKKAIVTLKEGQTIEVYEGV